MKEKSIDDLYTGTTGASGESNLLALVAMILAAAIVIIAAPVQAQVKELVMEQEDGEVSATEGEEGELEIEPPEEPIIMRSDIDSGDGGSDTTLELKMEGGAMLVGAEISGQEVYFVLDTGATYTTLTTEFARRARVSPHSGAPDTVVRTAGGVRRATFGIIDELLLGDQRLRGVSYLVCDDCGGVTADEERPLVGLLGRNVLDRYRVSVDSTGGEVELVRQENFDDQSADIEPWLQVGFGLPESASSPPPMKVENLARRSVQKLEIQIHCETVTGSEETIRTRTGRMRARSTQEISLDKAVTGCRDVELNVDSGRW